MLNDELGTQMQIYLALCDAYTIEIAENTESVMYLLRKMKPEVLLLDYDLDQFRLNGKTAVDFLKKIKKKYNHLKVLLILNQTDKRFENEIQESGGDGVLYKPIKNRKLVLNLRKLTTATA